MRPQLEAELQAHGHALRALARMLVGAAAADDLVQDTALQALRSPPPRESGLRAWLAQVLRRLANNHRRGEVRRQRHEQQVVPPESPTSAVRIAEHREALQRVTDALLALPEPYHGALLLRFCGELTPTAIAQQTGVPLATVKSRLQRGLAMLRERLDTAANGKDWRPALTAAFELQGTAALSAVATTTGVLLMPAAVKLAIGGAAAAAAVTAFLFLCATEPPTRTSQAQGTPSAPAMLTAPLLVPSSAAVPGPAERQPAPELATPSSAPRTPATLRGRCVDEHGHALAGVDVALHGWPASNERMDAWTRNHDDVPERIDEKMATGADGRFAFECWPPPPFLFSLRLTSNEHAAMEGWWSQLDAGSTKDVGSVVMLPGIALRGRVLDTDGMPVAKASLMLSCTDRGTGEITPSSQAHASTGADGTFHTHPLVAVGDYAIEVSPRRNAHPDRVALAPGVTVEIVVDKVEQRPEISGTVVDELGQPIARASVGVAPANGWSSLLGSVSASSDRNGVFHLQRSAEAMPEVTLLAQAEGFEDRRLREKCAWGRDDVRLTLRRGLAVEVSVVTAGGEPVEDFQVRVFPDPRVRDLPGNQHDVRARGHHPGGRVVIDGILRGACCVMVEPKGEQLSQSDFMPVLVADPGPARVTVVLQQRVEQPLRVCFADGTPLAAAKVQLALMQGQEPDPDTRFIAPTGEMWWQPGARLLLQEFTTDANGQAVLQGPRDVPLALSVQGAGHVPLLRSVQLGSKEPLVLTVSRGACVTGKVGPPAVLAELRRLADLPEQGPVGEDQRSRLPKVELVRIEGDRWITHPARDEVPIGADGSFRIAGAPAGRWSLCVVWDQYTPTDGGVVKIYQSEREFVASLELRDDTTIEHDVDVSRLLPGELDATVLSNGKPLGNVRLVVQCLTGKRQNGDDDIYTRYVTTDAEGRCHLRTRSGEYWLEVWNRNLLHGAERAFVVAGQATAQTFHLDSGTLRLLLVDAQGRRAPGVTLNLQDSLQSPHLTPRSPQTSDEQGVIEVELDARPFTLTILPRRLQEDPAAMQQLEQLVRQQGVQALAAVRIDLGRVTPKSGATTELELRLPPEWDR